MKTKRRSAADAQCPRRRAAVRAPLHKDIPAGDARHPPLQL